MERGEVEEEYEDGREEEVYCQYEQKSTFIHLSQPQNKRKLCFGYIIVCMSG